MTTLLAAVVSPVLGWDYADLPAGDECLTNRFGRSWSEAIGNGWLIVAGKYVDAPYIAEQRGNVIYVNGVRVDDEHPNSVALESGVPCVHDNPIQNRSVKASVAGAFFAEAASGKGTVPFNGGKLSDVR